MDIEPIVSPTENEILAAITLQSVKDNMRVTHNLEDQLIQEMVLEAFSFFDGRHGWMRRAMLTQQWRYFRTSVADDFELPMSPLVSVQSIAYRDTAGAWQTIASDTYEVITGDLLGRVVLAYGKEWPAIEERARAVRIEFTSGWTKDTMPPAVKRAVRLLVGSLYQNREADMSDNRVSVVSRRIEYGLEKLAGRWRIPNDQVDGVF